MGIEEAYPLFEPDPLPLPFPFPELEEPAVLEPPLPPKVSVAVPTAFAASPDDDRELVMGSMAATHTPLTYDDRVGVFDFLTLLRILNPEFPDPMEFLFPKMLPLPSELPLSSPFPFPFPQFSFPALLKLV